MLLILSKQNSVVPCSGKAEAGDDGASLQPRVFQPSIHSSVAEGNPTYDDHSVLGH